MQKFALKSFLVQFKTWGVLEWICLVASVAGVIALCHFVPSKALVIASALFNLVGACWLATGVWLSAEATAWLNIPASQQIVASTFKGASGKVWLAVLYFLTAAAFQILGVFI